MFPIKRNIELSDIPDSNRFGAVRKWDIHTGVDLFCPDGTPVYAFEDGVVTAIIDFTGEKVGTPWWNNTMAVGIEGSSGVILYGELFPIDSIEEGTAIKEGDLIGHIRKVLKKDKGKPMSMLHIELYKKGYRGNWNFWKEPNKKPEDLLNIEEVIFPEEFLKGSNKKIRELHKVDISRLEPLIEGIPRKT